MLTLPNSLSQRRFYGSVLRAFVAFLLCVFGLLLSAFGAGKIQPSPRHVFTNSVGALPAEAQRTLRPLQPAHLRETLEFEVPLQMRDYAKLVEKTGRAGAVSRAELERDYLPTPENYTGGIL